MGAVNGRIRGYFGFLRHYRFSQTVYEQSLIWYGIAVVRARLFYVHYRNFLQKALLPFQFAHKKLLSYIGIIQGNRQYQACVSVSRHVMNHIIVVKNRITNSVPARWCASMAAHVMQSAVVQATATFLRENETVVHVRKISGHKIITKNEKQVRIAIWSMVFVLVFYNGLNRVLEYTYKSDIEHELSLFFERNIKIDSLMFDFSNGIRLVASGVESRSSEGHADTHIQGIYLGLDFSELLGGEMNINYLHLDNVTVDHEFLAGLPAIFSGSPEEQTDESTIINISTFTASPVNVISKSGLHWGEYQVTVIMTPEKNLKLVKVVPYGNQTMTLTITPAENEYRFDVSANYWTLPGQLPLVIQQLESSGKMNANGLKTNVLKGKLYNGTFDADLSVDWKENIMLESRFSLENVDSGSMTGSSGQKIISGKLKTQGNIKIDDMAALDIFDKTTINADFIFSNGVIYKADLENAGNMLASNKSAAGTTRFDDFSGHIVTRSGNILLKKLKISSSALAADGRVNINHKNYLDGEIEVGVNNSKGILTVPLSISGTVDEPVIRPTKEAMVGGAVGTAILGPGIGTALGVKAGKAYNWFKELLQSDEKKEKSN